MNATFTRHFKPMVWAPSPNYASPKQFHTREVSYLLRSPCFYYSILEKETIQLQQRPPTLRSIFTLQTRIVKRIRSFTSQPADYSLTIFQTIAIITIGDKLLQTFHCLLRKITVTTSYHSRFNFLFEKPSYFTYK